FNVVDRKVDQLIMAAAGEPFVEHTLRPLHTIFRRIGWLHHTHIARGQNLQDSIDCHVALLDAVANRHVDKALAAVDDLIGFGARFARDLPQPESLQLFHVPGAGYDAVDLAAIPGSAVVCNCFGHEQAIAEYVMGALLERHVPLADADQKLRQSNWAYSSGSLARLHDELAEKTIGLLGYAHIGKAIALLPRA